MQDAGWIASIIAFVVASISIVHALLQRHDIGTLIAWIGLIVLLPIVGAMIYWLFGINRIREHTIREEHLLVDPAAHQMEAPSIPLRWQRLFHCGDRLSPFLVSGGNRIQPLTQGDAAYAMMLEAIDQAQTSISLATYIFEFDLVGRRFVEHLQAAVQRGVEVRVLIDGIGLRYSRRNTRTQLQQAGVPVAVFLPVHLLPRSLAAFNLRNHRKLLIVDGQHAFTGGMNIRRGHSESDPGSHPIQDLHFRVQGPVCSHLQRVFIEDWQFSTQEVLEGPVWFPETIAPAGNQLCRGLPDGPDEDFEILSFTLQAALAEARERVVVVTPYFLPNPTLMGALKTAALRGVVVDLLLPERGNLRLVEWASRPLHAELLERGCRIWLTPAPFNHAKLMLVDGEWSLIGSANWDPRSLRLNFEFNLECLDATLGRELQIWADDLRKRSHPLSLAEVEARPLFERMRDGIARLFSPYL